MQNKPILDGFLIFSFLFLIVLITLVVSIVFWDSCQALTCWATLEKTVVQNSEYIWDESDEIIRLLRESEITTEKEAIVKQVSSTVIKWPNYTIRVGLQWSRKPIPTIKGTTTQERAKEWLETVWLGYTLPTWIELGKKYKIDYTLAISIAWADSHLWKALKSTNNIGNVWNNDRWDVVHYDSLEKGIEAIFRTLNNRYMGGNEIIGELSGEGRTRLNITPCSNVPAPNKCYATSLWVWSTNVTNAMSVIHNKEIREDFEFRIK